VPSIFSAVASTVTNILKISPVNASELYEVEGFPIAAFNEQQMKYIDYERWYSGENLDDTVTGSSGKEIQAYPVKINPVKGAVHKHAQALFGQIAEDDRPLVVPKVSPIFKETDSEGEGASDKYDKLEQILHFMWYQNNGRSLQLEAGLASQIYGGCIFMLRWTPTQTWKPIPIEIQSIPAKFFYAIPDPSNPFLCYKAWIIKYISKEEAAIFGVTVDDGEEAAWIEEWSAGSYKITINGKLASMAMIDTNGKTIQMDLGGANPWGFVPCVYIPHVRFGGFWGESLIDGLEGLAKEINARSADIGDAVSQDSHSVMAMRNVSGNYPVMKQVAPGVSVLNLGANPALTGNEAQPDLFDVTTKSATETMGNFVGDLYQQFRRQAFIPAVADGEDEGSQRSALTLAVRFWPLVGHVMMERIFWTTGMNIFNQMILKALNVKSGFVGEFAVSDEDLMVKMEQQWAPILPKDREAEVNEAVNRVVNNLGSPQTLMAHLGDIDDPEAEMKLILEFEQALADIEKEKDVAVAEAQGEAMAKRSQVASAGGGSGKPKSPTPGSK
jgi:hypothetical protein